MRCALHFIPGARDQMSRPRASRELDAALMAAVVTLPTGRRLMAEAPDAVLAAMRVALRQLQCSAVFDPRALHPTRCGISASLSARL